MPLVAQQRGEGVSLSHGLFTPTPGPIGTATRPANSPAGRRVMKISTQKTVFRQSRSPEKEHEFECQSSQKSATR
jgi:hypothetical protein